MPATRILTPAQQALKRGIFPFMRYMWEHETVVALSVVIGTIPIAGYLIVPQSFWKMRDDEVKSMPKKYPTPIRYVEGKTGPPTEV